MRLYKSDSRWAFWRWTITPSWYIIRLHLLKTPWFAIMLHWINRPDPEPHLHDHPVSFLSLILRGGYEEERERKESYGDFWGAWPTVRLIRHRWANYIHATDKHRIVYVKPHTLTLCFAGPKVREWGFYTPSGFIPWKEYNRKYG